MSLQDETDACACGQGSTSRAEIGREGDGQQEDIIMRLIRIRADTGMTRLFFVCCPATAGAAESIQIQQQQDVQQ